MMKQGGGNVNHKGRKSLEEVDLDGLRSSSAKAEFVKETT